MNTITDILRKKQWSQLPGNVAISSEEGTWYINADTGEVSTEKTTVEAVVEMPVSDWLSVLKDSGNLGRMIIAGKAKVTGQVCLAFSLSDMIG